jgi:CheY-like chemotaxis protein
MMPQMDGSEVCQALDERPQLRSQHIIVLMSAMDKLAEVSALNVDTTMPKPFTVDDIMRILQRYLNN